MNTVKAARGHQHKPTRSEISAAWGRLREAANGGNMQASALLISLVENRSLLDLSSVRAARAVHQVND